MTPEERKYATAGISQLGYTNPDDLELQGYLKENPYQAPAPSREDQLSQIGAGLQDAQRQANEIQAGIARLQSQGGTTETAPVEPTVGDLFAGTEVVDPYAGFREEYENFLKQETAAYDPEKIRQQEIAKMQAQIDATNAMYADELRRAQMQGRGRLGTSTAISARRGLIGSDFGEAQYRATEDENRQIEQSIENERLAAISALMSKARDNAAQEIRERRAAMLGGYEKRMEWYAGEEQRKAEKASKAIQALIGSGVNPEDLSANDLDFFAKNYGLTKNDLMSQYKSAVAESESAALEDAKTQAEIDKIEAEIAKGKYVTIGEGTQLYNTETGEVIKNPKTYAPQSSSSGLTPYQQFNATQSLAKDVQKRTESAREMTRQASIITNAYNNIIEGGDRSLNTQSMIVAFNKILDPTSVVRESEYDRTAAGQALITRLEGKLENLTQGGAGVDVETTLSEAVDIANQYIAGAKASIDQENQRARDIANQFGINPDFVGSTNFSVDQQEKTVKERAEAAGYDYEAIKADNPNLSDAQIEADLGL